jgi:hypothetical protein
MWNVVGAERSERALPPRLQPRSTSRCGRLFFDSSKPLKLAMHVASLFRYDSILGKIVKLGGNYFGLKPTLIACQYLGSSNIALGNPVKVSMNMAVHSAESLAFPTDGVFPMDSVNFDVNYLHGTPPFEWFRITFQNVIAVKMTFFQTRYSYLVYIQ